MRIKKIGLNFRGYFKEIMDSLIISLTGIINLTSQ